jgi:hypothetical protein
VHFPQLLNLRTERQYGQRSGIYDLLFNTLTWGCRETGRRHRMIFHLMGGASLNLSSRQKPRALSRQIISRLLRRNGSRRVLDMLNSHLHISNNNVIEPAVVTALGEVLRGCHETYSSVHSMEVALEFLR